MHECGGDQLGNNLESTVNVTPVGVITFCHLHQAPGMKSKMIVQQHSPVIFNIKVIESAQVFVASNNDLTNGRNVTRRRDMDLKDRKIKDKGIVEREPRRVFLGRRLTLAMYEGTIFKVYRS